MFRIEVENIKCSGCIDTIKKTLLAINGVQSVTIDIDNGFVIITGDGDREQIVQRLTQMGYPEKGNNSFGCKTRSYLSCALGKI
ncbi:heavy-metal-associated domain-containing protein [Flavobacterium caeni]|uniref:Copper chaperone CopZ n=1 Tax=Flavobacterium caeni TaxID=490189 RepID=A0A1G5K782_9FLAO|nr:heavy metal-associated domain-containing protein [Flavobacterium caeni]SCY96465.1 Copper chaperone CopZ [Flavobacterium caeni]